MCHLNLGWQCSGTRRALGTNVGHGLLLVNSTNKRPVNTAATINSIAINVKLFSWSVKDVKSTVKSQKLNRKNGWTRNCSKEGTKNVLSFGGLNFFLQKFKWSMHSDESIRSFVMLTERSISCRGPGVILTLPKKRKGDWKSFAKRYVPRNPGSAIFVDATLFGVVEIVGNFERELYGTLDNW